MKNNIRKAVESLFKYYYPLNEAFESSTIKTFFNKAKELLQDEPSHLIIGIWWGGYYNYRWLHSMEDFKNCASDLGLGNFKDEYLWKGKEKYQNESGIYTQNEVVKNLGINGNLSYDNIKDGSLAAYCSKVPTAFLGIITVDNTGKDMVKQINFGLFIDPKKGLDFIKYINQHFEKKDSRNNNKVNSQNNFDFSLENAIKTNEDIQNYLKVSSKEQQELMKKIVNETQQGDKKYLADTDAWLDEKTFNYLKTEIYKVIKNEGNNKNNKQTKASLEQIKNIKLNDFTKVEAKNKLKIFRFNVIRLLCQPKEQTLTESNWYKRLNDNSKKYILNAYQLLHKDLKKLTDEDKESIKKQINNDWKNILTNKK